MALRDTRPASERPKSQVALAAIAPVVATPFWRLDENGDWYASETGPADGYTKDNGDGSVEPSAAISAHESYFRKTGDDYAVG